VGLGFAASALVALGADGCTFAAGVAAVVGSPVGAVAVAVLGVTEVGTAVGAGGTLDWQALAPNRPTRANAVRARRQAGIPIERGFSPSGEAAQIVPMPR
jgi:hypothetical protein